MIEEYGSTVPVPPGVHVEVDHLGALVLRRAGAGEASADARAVHAGGPDEQSHTAAGARAAAGDGEGSPQ